MPRNVNSAFRVLRILRRAKQSTPGSTVATASTGDPFWHEAPRVPTILEGWTDVFGVKADDPVDRAFAVTEKLRLLHQEVLFAYQSMLETEVDSELFDDAFAATRNGLGPQDLHGSWATYQNTLTTEIFKTLAFCAELIPTEEYLLGEAELGQVWGLLESLRQAIDASELPDDLQGFLREQVAIITEALDAYEITGARAFRRALVDASLSYSEHEADVTAYGDAREVKLLGGIWGTLTRMNERSEVVQKLLGSGVKILKLIGDAGDVVSRAL